LVVGGTHLKGKYKGGGGGLLTASDHDANFQVYPLGFAVVDSENDDSWTWFFTKLERITADNKTLTILSDRHSSILVTVKRVFRQANHGACIIHLCRNIQAKYKNKALTQLVKNAGYAATSTKFKELYGQIESMNQNCGKYLHDIEMANWTRLYFRGHRLNLMTSIIAKTLNKALNKGRSSHIVGLIRFIRSMLTRWFNARQKKSLEHKGPVPSEVDKQITKNMLTTNGSKVGRITNWSYEINGMLGGRNVVDLEKKQCTCKSYDKLKIPCSHALVAANSYKISYKVSSYREAVFPEAIGIDEEIPEELEHKSMLPPYTTRPLGRPKVARIPSTGKYKVRKKLS